MLLIVILLLIALAGFWGLWRGIQRGFLTMLAILFAALLVDLWGNTWTLQLRERFQVEDVSSLEWLTTITAFSMVTLILGYGSGLLLPRPKTPKRMSFNERLIGGLLGVLNGMLMTAFVLRYGIALRPPAFAATVRSEIILSLLHAWLPWYILVSALMLHLLIIYRAIMRIVQFLLQPRLPVGAPRHPGAGLSKTQRQGTYPYDEPPLPPNVAKQLHINAKIDQALREHQQ